MGIVILLQAQLVYSGTVRFASPDAHQQVGTPEQNMEPVHILGNATVCNFPIPEIPFDYEKGVLYLTANR